MWETHHQLKERRKLRRQLRRDADKSTLVCEHRVHRRFDLRVDLLTLSLFAHRLASRSQADCRNPSNPFMVAAPQRESRNRNTVGFKGTIRSLITSDCLCRLLLAKQTVDLFCDCFVLFFEFAYWWRCFICKILPPGLWWDLHFCCCSHLKQNKRWSEFYFVGEMDSLPPLALKQSFSFFCPFIVLSLPRATPPPPPTPTSTSLQTLSGLDLLKVTFS